MCASLRRGRCLVGITSSKVKCDQFFGDSTKICAAGIILKSSAMDILSITQSSFGDQDTPIICIGYKMDEGKVRKSCFFLAPKSVVF